MNMIVGNIAPVQLPTVVNSKSSQAGLRAYVYAFDAFPCFHTVAISKGFTYVSSLKRLPLRGQHWN